MRTKRIFIGLALVLLCTLLLIPAERAEASGMAVFSIGQKSFQRDGHTLPMDVAPYIKDGRTMVPVAFVAPALGTEEAVWYPFDRTVYIKKGNDTVVIKIGSNVIHRNNEQFYMDTAAEVKTVGAGGGRTMLPIAWIARALEVAYDWDPFSRSVYFYGETHKIDVAGTYGPATGTQTLQGAVILEVSDIVLQNTHIKGNLIIAESVGTGKVNLNNVTVTGATYIRGGGKDSIYINRGSYNRVFVQTKKGPVRIVSEGVSGLDLIVEGVPQGGEVILEGSFDEVELMDSRVKLFTNPSTNIQHLTVGTRGTNSVLNLATHTLVRKMTVKGMNLDVQGAGVIQEAIVFADGTTFAYQPQKLTVGQGGTQPATTVPRQTTKFMLAGHTPADNATGVGINAVLRMTFSKNVIPVSGKNIRIYRGDGVLFRTISVMGSEIGILNNQVTITPGQRFAPESDYYILIDSGAFKDRDGNLYGGMTAKTTWNFTTGKTPEITVASFTPAKGAANIAVDATLSIDFSEAPQAVSGKNIYLYSSEGTLVETIAATNTARVTINNRKVSIDPTANLAYATGYYVLIDSGAFQNSLGTIYSGIADDTTWTFSTLASPFAPRVVTYTPANNAKDVAANANLELTFNKTVSAVSGKRIIIFKKDGTEVERIDAGNTDQVTVGGNRAVIRPLLPLELSSEYYVMVDAGAFKDEDDNNYGGITDANTWKFTTATSTGAPIIVAFSPGPRATNVSRATNLSLTFNKTVTAAANRYITIVKKSDHSDFERIPVTDTTRVRINSVTNEVTVNPAYLTGVLAKSTEYYVLVDQGSFRDAENVSFAGILNETTWSFTTTASDAPVITRLSPQSGENQVPKVANLEITFNETVTAITGKKIMIYNSNGTLFEEQLVTGSRVSVSGAKVTVDPVKTFETAKSYYVLIERGAFRGNVSNLEFEGVTNTTRWIFTATDALAAQVLSLTPENGANNVAGDVVLRIVFSEGVRAGSNAAIIISSGAEVWETIPASDTSRVTITGNIVEILRTRPFDPNKAYQVLISDGCFEDIVGNKIAGLNTITWTFTTGSGGLGDFEESGFFPASGAIDVSLDTELRVTFNQNIGSKGTAGYVVIHEVTGVGTSRVHEAISTADARVEVAANTNRATVTGFARLKSDTEYYITLSEGSFLNINGERNPGITNPNTWRFTTELEDTTQPMLRFTEDGRKAIFDLATDGIRVKRSGTVILEFNEPVQTNPSPAVINFAKVGGLKSPALSWSIVPASSDRKVQITYENLDANSEYYIEINNAIEDLAGNMYVVTQDASNGAADPTWIRFTTEIAVPPKIIFASPTGTEGSNREIVFTFNENVRMNAGGFLIIYESDAAGIIGNHVASINLSGSAEFMQPAAGGYGNVIRVTYTLASDQYYRILLTNGAFTGITGGTFTGVNVGTSRGAFTTTTGDETGDVTVSGITVDGQWFYKTAP